METIPYTQQYAILRSQGLTPSAAAIALCSDNKAHLSWVVRWLSMENPETVAFHERWVKHTRAENRERVWLVGYVEEGCYFYASLSHRPEHTVFIKWDEIGSIYIQDGQHLLALAIYSPGPYGGKHLQAQSNIACFSPFVQEVSVRFFGTRDYLDSKFKPGGHDVRKLQVCPENALVEKGASNVHPAQDY